MSQMQFLNDVTLVHLDLVAANAAILYIFADGGHS